MTTQQPTANKVTIKGLSNLPLDQKVGVFVQVSMPQGELDEKLQGIPRRKEIERILAIREFAAKYFQPVLDYLNERGIPHSEIPLSETIETTLTAKQIEELAGKDYVAGISEKSVYSPS